MSKRMRLAPALVLAALLAALWAAPSAQAEFGIHNFDVTFANQDGTEAIRAGSHPFAMTTSFAVNESGGIAEGEFEGSQFDQIAGLMANATALPRCTDAEFLAQGPDGNGYNDILGIPNCPGDSQIGYVEAFVGNSEHFFKDPLFMLTPPPGVAARIGFKAATVHIVVDLGIRQRPPYVGVARQAGIPQIEPIFGARLVLWGDPADEGHDYERGNRDCSSFEVTRCPSGIANPRPLLTLPASCEGPQRTSYAVDSWADPGRRLPNGEADLADPAWKTGYSETHTLTEPPLPQGFALCGAVPFTPTISAQPTTTKAEAPTGLDFGISFDQEGLTSPDGIAQSEMKKAVIELPAGVTVNPSIAEGLGVCSEADLARETIGSEPGEGCPESSKIGTVEVQTPLVAEAIGGSVYIAKPYANEAGDSLIAFYIVLRNRNLGVLVKQPARVEPDPVTGQLKTVVEEIPQVPFSHFSFHFREGQRAPLITPRTCGHYTATAELTPWSDPAHPRTVSAGFDVSSGVGGGACPGGAPFGPGFEAGTLNNQAGSYSPFTMRLTRGDGEQDMGKFSFVLPPGVVPKLAGIPYCSEAGIARARGRQGAHGGTEEKDDPSCPAAAEIGRTVAGAGVGSQLTYVPGKLYLAGPYNGDPISAVAITPAVAGPFDAGVVVVREALRLNPVTHVGEVDGSASDPIPHILKGIPLNLRDLRVYADRPEFTLNPTSCEPFEARSTIWGDGTASEPQAPHPVDLASRFQAAGCASLGFKPRLGLRLTGGTGRGAFPALRAVYAPRKHNQANLSRLALTFPNSAFIEQGHFRTICTRVQFAAGAGFGSQCPRGSIYGHIKVWTPLLDEPLQGPVYLRSSNHNLPDLVAALHSDQINVNLVGRIDSVKGGGIRNTFEFVPDAPHSCAAPYSKQFCDKLVKSLKVKLAKPAQSSSSSHRELVAFHSASTSKMKGGKKGGKKGHKKKGKKRGNKLGFSGSMKRGGHPSLHAVVTMKPGGANIASASVALPHSAFLDQAHIRTICTRVQFAEGDGHGSACPKGSIYGHAKAVTPLLDYALEGNVYLRSSSHKLPDLVPVLEGPSWQPIAIVLDGRIDSVHGGIRSKFEAVPDAPVSRFTLDMQGGKKGLIVNSRNLCKGKNRATFNATGQNGKLFRARPVVHPVSCPKRKRRHHRGHRHKGKHGAQGHRGKRR